MARDAAPERSFTGLHAWLLEAEEEEAGRSMPHPCNTRRLAALRTGRPVDVCAGDLPAWARVGQDAYWWNRAMVTAAGVVTFYVDGGTRWLEDNGL